MTTPSVSSVSDSMKKRSHPCLNNPTATFEVMDCREIHKADSRYDAIMCGFSLPYISKDDARKLILDASRLLRAEGIIYLSTMEGNEKDLSFDISSSGDRVFTHFHRGDYLTQYLTKSGFEIIDVKRKTYPKADGSETTDLFIVAQISPPN